MTNLPWPYFIRQLIFCGFEFSRQRPQVVVEAQACGCPVTGFMTGGIPDMMIPAERSNLVNPKDSQALAKK